MAYASINAGQLDASSTIDQFPVETVSVDSLEDPIYIKIDGRIFKLLPQALKSYATEFGLVELDPLDFQECLRHIVGELRLALRTVPKVVGTRRRLSQYESPSMIFKLVGSKVVNMRISLKYNSREPKEEV